MPALVFDCDGVLADTERDGHRVAFNRAFNSAGLPLRWDVDEYARFVRIGGGKERLAAALDPESVTLAAATLGCPPEQVVARLHSIKSAHFRRLVAEGAMPGRPGVARLVREALEADWAVAVASSSALPSVRAVLQSAVGEDIEHEVRIFAGDQVAAKKPAPDIYLLALERLGVEPFEVVVVEDSAIGLTAARHAGLRVLVTVSSYTAGEEFTGAAAVLSDLGEPDAPLDILADPYMIMDGRAVVDIACLEAILESVSLGS